jgi:hypothetical protein
VLQSEQELVEARRLAEQGWQAFPETPGGRACYNLIQQIEAKSASISTERVWNQPWPTIQVTYRNVNKVFFRMVPWDFQQRMTSASWHPENLDFAEADQTADSPTGAVVVADLPATDDYQQRTEDLPAPQDLKPGFYFLVASHDAEFGGKQSPISYADDLLHRPVAVPARADDPVQGHLHPRGPEPDDYKTLPASTLT